MILPAAALNVPLLTTFPKRSSIPFAPMVSVPPVLIVIFLAVPAPPLRFGMLGAEEGIITSIVEVGTPPHQLEAVFQSVLVKPVQVCNGITVIVIAMDVAVDWVTHVNEVVITTVTTSLFTSVAFW